MKSFRRTIPLLVLLSAFCAKSALAQLPPPPPPPNLDPTCDLGDDISVVATGLLTPVELVPVSATDPDGDDALLAYSWSVPIDSGAEFEGGIVDGPTAVGLFPVGDTVVTLQVTDPLGGSSACEVTVSITLPAPPVIACEVDPQIMWPPNHKMREVTIVANASSDVAALPTDLVISCLVSSDEPDSARPGDRGGDVNGEDGHTAPVSVDLEYDADEGAYVGTLRLRSEREGSGDGRIYSLATTAEDIFGQTGSDDCIVFVPHDRSQGLPTMVDEAKEKQAAKKRGKKGRKKDKKKKKKRGRR